MTYQITLSDGEYAALVAAATKSGTASISWLSDRFGGDEGHGCNGGCLLRAGVAPKEQQRSAPRMACLSPACQSWPRGRRLLDLPPS